MSAFRTIYTETSAIDVIQLAQKHWLETNQSNLQIYSMFNRSAELTQQPKAAIEQTAAPKFKP